MCFFGTRLLNPELLHLGKDFMIVAFAVIAFCHSVMFFEFGAWFYIHYIWELKTSFRELDRQTFLRSLIPLVISITFFALLPYLVIYDILCGGYA